MLETQIVVLGLVALTVVGVALWFWRRPTEEPQRKGPTNVQVVRKYAAPTPVNVSQGESLIVPGPQEILMQLYSVAFDDASLGAEQQVTSAEHGKVVSHAAAILNGIATQPRYTPRRPALLAQLMQSLEEDDSSVRGIARIVGQDPSLTGNLLRVANSPAYRVSKAPVENIERAITLIGTEGIRSMITAALLQPVLTGDDGAFAKFPEIIWEHTLFSASAAEAHANAVERADPFAAQLLALLQGLGSIIVFRVTRDQYAAQPQLAPEASVIAGLLDAQAAPTARRIAEGWQLSDRIIAALDDQSLQSDPEYLSPLGRSLRFGRLAGALLMLRRLDKLNDAQARAALLGSDSHGAEVERIWERMVKGHRLD